MNLPGEKCPLKRKKICSECSKARQQWFVDKLLNDLADQKNKPLTPKEQCWLLLLLQGLCPDQIADRLNYKNLRPDLSKSIYSYVASLTNKNKISDWAQVRLYLEKAEYRRIASANEEIIIQIRIPGNIDPEIRTQLMGKLIEICGGDLSKLEVNNEE